MGSHGRVLSEGRAVGDRVATGAVRVIASPAELAAFRPGEVLVADTTTPDWEPVMKTAAAVVTERGGRACHAAIVARELGIPAVVGTGDATSVLRTGDIVTVSCAEGDVGRIYAGEAEVRIETTDMSDLRRPHTKIMVNLGNPDLAFHTALLPSDGVGLARMEFIISESIKAHPMALIHPERVTDRTRGALRSTLTQGYPDGAAFFVERLAEGVGTIAAAFHPRPVVVRMSDFKTNEYARLLGGADFEPREENPMMGFRGASRYAHPAYTEGFALECRAMLRVREEMGLDNVVLMLPFVRRLEEADLVLDRMAELGLRRGDRRPADLRDVRDPQQRRAHRRVRQAVRRLLDRLERPHPADPRGGPRQRPGCLRLRRARPRGQADDPLGGRGLPAQRHPLRALWPGAVGLSRDGGVPRRDRHRLDEPQPRQCAVRRRVASWSSRTAWPERTGDRP